MPEPIVESKKLNGWTEWSKYVLKELERLAKCFEDIDKKLDLYIVELTVIKVKAGLWGALSGSVATLIGILIWYFTKG
jgi:hypothetical protein